LVSVTLIGESQLHISGYLAGKVFGAPGFGTIIELVNGGAEQGQPALEILRLERLPGVDRAVNIHGVALIASVAQKQLFPIAANQGQVALQVDAGNVEKDRGKPGVSQQPGVEGVYQRGYCRGTIEVRQGL
jgi:hypothetical protein